MQRLADLPQAEQALRVELGQHSGEALLAGLQVNRAGQAEVADGIDCAGIGVARLGNGHYRGAEVRLGRLGVQIERIAPLVVAGAGLDLPGGLKRGHFGLCAHVIQHHGQHEFAVGAAGADAPVHETVENEAAGVPVPRPLPFHLFGQERRECALQRPVGVELLRAVLQLGLLLDDKKSFPLRRKFDKMIHEVVHVCSFKPRPQPGLFYLP